MDQQLLRMNTESSDKKEDKFPYEWLLYLLQVIELHGYLSEEKVDVGSPLHSTDKIWLCYETRKTLTVRRQERLESHLEGMTNRWSMRKGVWKSFSICKCIVYSHKR